MGQLPQPSFHSTNVSSTGVRSGWLAVGCSGERMGLSVFSENREALGACTWITRTPLFKGLVGF